MTPIANKTLLAIVWAYFGLAAGLVAWAYQPALDAPFVFDDQQNIVDSPAIRWTNVSWQNIESLFHASRLQNRPVANFSFALDYMRGGLQPNTFHLTNVLIHLAVGGALAWLGFLYVRLSHNREQLSAAAGARALWVLLPVGVFLIHPLNTQAVTYVVQRMTSLATLFTLLAFASYLMARYRVTARNRSWYFMALVLWMMAIASKEIGVLLLPVVLLYELCFFRSEWVHWLERVLGVSWTQKHTVVTWLSFGVLLVSGAWAIMISTPSIGLTTEFPGRDFSGIERFMTQARVQIFHLSQLVYPAPTRLNLDHDFSVSRSLTNPSTTLPAIFACVALLAGAIVIAGRRPRYGFPLVAYAVFHSIESGPISLEILFEHRMYLPMTMLALVCAALLVDSRPQRMIFSSIAVLVITLVFATWTHERNTTWVDPLAFARDVASKSPNKARAHHNLADALLDDGQLEAALGSIQRAIELDPESGRPHRLHGRILMELGRPDEAVNAYQTSVKFAPSNVRALLGLGAALSAAGAEEEAFELYFRKGIEFGRSGAPHNAIPFLERTVDMRREDAAARSALGSAYLAAGLDKEALEQLHEAVRLDQDKIAAWFNIGIASDALGLREEALRGYEAFVDRAPIEMVQQILRAEQRIEALLDGAQTAD